MASPYTQHEQTCIKIRTHIRFKYIYINLLDTLTLPYKLTMQKYWRKKSVCIYVHHWICIFFNSTFNKYCTFHIVERFFFSEVGGWGGKARGWQAPCVLKTDLHFHKDAKKIRLHIYYLRPQRFWFGIIILSSWCTSFLFRKLLKSNTKWQSDHKLYSIPKSSPS